MDRAALVGAARRYDTTLVVDETWAETALDDAGAAGAADVRARTPLAAFDNDGRVISIGSASKLWWGGLRIGWIRGTAALVRPRRVPGRVRLSPEDASDPGHVNLAGIDRCFSP